MIPILCESTIPAKTSLYLLWGLNRVAIISLLNVFEGEGGAPGNHAKTPGVNQTDLRKWDLCLRKTKQNKERPGKRPRGGCFVLNLLSDIASHKNPLKLPKSCVLASGTRRMWKSFTTTG